MIQPETERQRASEQHLRKVLDSLFTFVGVLTPDGSLTEINRAALEAASLRPEVVLGKPFEQTFWWSYSPEVQARLRAAIYRAAAGEMSRFDVPVQVASGRLITIDFMLSPMFDDQGRVTHLIPSGIDITERKRAEESLRRRETELRAILDTTVDGIITIDDKGTIETFNPAAERLFGYTAAEAVGKNVRLLMPPPSWEEHDGYIARYLATGERRIIGIGREVIGRRKDGSTFPLDLAVAEYRVGEGRKFTGSLRDISERRQAEEHIREQAALIEKAHDAIVVYDAEERIVFWSHAAERLYGWTAREALGKRYADLIQGAPPEIAQAGRTVLEKGEWSGELRQHTKDGREIVVESRRTLLRDAQGRPRSQLVLNIDITEKKRLEARTHRAQRLESLGTLASGVAHDLNNVLTPILMSVKLLQKNPAEGKRQRLLAALQAGAERGADMVRQLVAFAGGEDGERSPLQMKHVIREVKSILEHTLPKSIRMRIDLGQDLWPVRGDATQLAQVLMNLCINARDAMPDGGMLTIVAENKLLDERYTRRHTEGRPGPHVLLTITDTGTGIPTDVLDRIFDPFFTTKPHGKGTGLGLPTVLGIVRSHGGFIAIYSEAGKGSRFVVHLPAAEAAALEQSVGEVVEAAEGRGELILIVDDEASIVETAKEILEEHGYRALTAGDGAEALALFRQHRSDVRAVLLDLMMPGLDGAAVMKSLHEVNSEAHIIASSGLRPAENVAEAVATHARAFLQKPYTDQQLLNVLARVLRTPSPVPRG